MSEDFGIYHPQAAGHSPYQENMAAWRALADAERGHAVGHAAPPAPEAGEVIERQEVRALTEVDRNLLGQLQETLDRYQADGASEAVSEAFESGEKGVTTPTVSEDSERPGDFVEVHISLFDPAEHNAPAVLEYLEKADRSEVKRVLTAEKGGKARKGILKLEADLLAKASD